MKRSIIKSEAFLGIDPGLDGALSVISADCKTVMNIYDMPVVAKTTGKGRQLDAYGLISVFKDICSVHSVIFVYIEDVGSRPSQSAPSTFSLGRTFGSLETAVAFMRLRCGIIRPQDWKKEFGLIKKDKDASRLMAYRMFPLDSEFFSRRKDVDRAEASLIALHGANKYRSSQ